jgi:hypothetical protein
MTVRNIFLGILVFCLVLGLYWLGHTLGVELPPQVVLLFRSAVSLFCLALPLLILRSRLYRPPQNMLGVINYRSWWFRDERLRRFVYPGRWTILHLGERPAHPFNLTPRFTELRMPHLLTQDLWVLQGRMIVNFTLDVSQAAPDFWVQGVSFQPKIWRGIIENNVRPVVRALISGQTAGFLLSPDGPQSLGEWASDLLAQRLQRLGVIGARVSIQELRPVDRLMHSIQEQAAAPLLGQAAVDRINPSLQAASHSPDPAWTALLMSWSSAVSRGDNAPQSIAIDGWHPPVGSQPPSGSGYPAGL